MNYLEIGIRSLVGMVFLISFSSKIASRAAFAEFFASVRGMEAVPSTLIWPTAVATTAMEAAIVVLVAIPAYSAQLTGLAISAGLLAAFNVVILKSIRRGTRTKCGCFGTSSAPLGYHHLIRNTGLIIASLVGLTFLSSGPIEDPGGSLVALAAGVTLGTMVTKSEQLIELFMPIAAVSEPKSRHLHSE